MKSYANKLLLALFALLAISVAPLHGDEDPGDQMFFTPQTLLGPDADGYPVYYLSYFNTYTYDPADETYVYKYNFGWLYDFGGSTTDSDDVYFYDFTADDVFYTSPGLYPYFYSFNKDAFLYYFEDSDPREFYEFDTDTYIYY